jgi:hypothetical protein
MSCTHPYLGEDSAELGQLLGDLRVLRLVRRAELGAYVRGAETKKRMERQKEV